MIIPSFLLGSVLQALELGSLFTFSLEPLACSRDSERICISERQSDILLKQRENLPRSDEFSQLLYGVLFPFYLSKSSLFLEELIWKSYSDWGSDTQWEKIFHPLVRFPSGCNSHIWTRGKPGVPLGSLSWVAEAQAFRPPCAFRGTLAGSQIRNGTDLAL